MNKLLYNYSSIKSKCKCHKTIDTSKNQLYEQKTEDIANWCSVYALQVVMCLVQIDYKKDLVGMNDLHLVMDMGS